MRFGKNWGATEGERMLAFACDAHVPAADDAYYRAVTVDAPPPVIFAWLCQLRVAPYSYDWLDNFGRRSPQRLTPGLTELVVGQRFMRIFDLAEFERDRQITLRLRRGRRLFGDLAVTYTIRPISPESCRLLAKLVVRYPRAPFGWLVRIVLPSGDWLMMRRQLLNLKSLTERRPRPEA
jgi:hypothetical protein